MARWARLVFRSRWIVLILAALSVVPAIGLILRGADLDPAYLPAATESGRAAALLAAELPATPPSFMLILGSRTHTVDDAAFREAVDRALAPLRRDRRVRSVHTPFDGPQAGDISKDRHWMIAVVQLAGRSAPFGSSHFADIARDIYPAVRASVTSPTLDVVAAGDLPFTYDLVAIAERDVRRIEVVVLPVVLILLLLVFGSAVAAALPLGIGLLAVAAGIAGTFVLARVMSVSIYATNVVSMIGLGVAIDYALFVVTRFREELAARPLPDALAVTLATAGRAILFSGLTVMIGLIGLLFLGLGDLGAIGLAGAIVVALSVVYSLTLLPALLAVLGPRVNRFRVPFVHPQRAAQGGAGWRAVAAFVMRHPWPVLVPVTGLLLLLGSPVLHLDLASSGVTTLPATAESRRGADLLRSEFPQLAMNRIVAVVHSVGGSPLARGNIGRLYDFGQWFAALPDVDRVLSPVTLDPRLRRADYERLLAQPPAALPPPLRAAVAQMIGPHVVTFAASTRSEAKSDAALRVVRLIRDGRYPAIAGEILVTGETASDLDVRDTIERHAPRALAFIIGTTLVVLFLLLRSVLLPIKAVLMNLLSITASYGALVWLFQWGHLAGWLRFTPGPIETVTPIIMFCVVFGLSMDYEVLLLSRTREEYERTGDNAEAVVQSLARTGRLITGAALIMASVFLGFGAATMMVVKAVGVGMGIAVLVDATIVRALLVPAAMRLLGQWNWWMPGARR